VLKQFEFGLPCCITWSNFPDASLAWIIGDESVTVDVGLLVGRLVDGAERGGDDESPRRDWDRNGSRSMTSRKVPDGNLAMTERVAATAQRWTRLRI